MSRLSVPLTTDERASLREVRQALGLGVQVGEAQVARLLIIEALRRRGLGSHARTQSGGEE